MRSSTTVYTALCAGALLTACREAPITTVGTPSFSAVGTGSTQVVNVSRDTTAQNETPLAFNPKNPLNMITGNNDWNYNDGCGVNATFDGGRTWSIGAIPRRLMVARQDYRLACSVLAAAGEAMQ